MSGDGKPVGGRPGTARTGNDRLFKILAGLAGLVLIGFIAFVVSSRSSTPPRSFPTTAPTALRTGSLAPAFSLTRLGGGHAVDLAASRGHPTMVNFFASWCPDCRAELQAVAATAKQDAGRVSVIGVDTNDTNAAAAERLLAAAGATYPVAVDATARVAQQYRVSVLPVTYFLDARGRVVGEAFGTQTTASLHRWTERLLGQESPR